MAALARFLALRRSERRRTVEAAFWLLLVRLAFGILPFRRALGLFRITLCEAAAGRIDANDAGEIGRAVERAARHVPFRAVCLQQAFAALMMMRRRGLAGTARFGLARDQHGGLAAHAWTHCGELPVTGVAAARGYVAVAAFAA